MRIIFACLLLTNIALADASYEDLKKQMQVLQEAREADRRQQEDPSYWMMRDRILQNRLDLDDSISVRMLKRQVLIDQYPEYFDPNYNYDRSKKYVDIYDY